MKSNPTIETASATLIADYLRDLYSIAERNACNEYSTIWHTLYNKIMSEDIYSVIMQRFDNFDWEPTEDSYESYKDECEDFIASFIDFAARENEDLFPTFNDCVKQHI